MDAQQEQQVDKAISVLIGRLVCPTCAGPVDGIIERSVTLYYGVEATDSKTLEVRSSKTDVWESEVEDLMCEKGHTFAPPDDLEIEWV